MFMYGLLTGFVIGIVISVVLLFIFASARVASEKDDKEKMMYKEENEKNIGK